VQSRRGELRPLVPLPGGYLGYSQPGRSVVMLSAPKGPKYVGTLVRQAAADATLYPGSKQVVCVRLAPDLGYSSQAVDAIQCRQTCVCYAASPARCKVQLPLQLLSVQR
jgi:hypothetical protein